VSVDKTTLCTTGSRSPFAVALAMLLDETCYFTRSEWARFLGVSTSAISQWVNDKTVPRADLLRIILDVLRTSDGVPPEPLKHFDEVANRPACEVSALGARMMPTVAEYLRRSTFASLGRDLRTLSAKQQETVLAEGSWETQASPGGALLGKNFAFDLFDSAVQDEKIVDNTLLPYLVRLRGSQPQARISMDSLVSSRAVLVVGEAGCGKSAIFGALGRAFQQRAQTPRVFIRAHVWWSHGAGPAPLEACEGIARRSGVMLIDGFDEIRTEHRAVAAQEIVDLERRSPSLQIFVSSRPVPELSLFKEFESFSVAPLTSIQVILWLKRAIEGSERTQRLDSAELERFVCHLTESTSLHTSLRNPLLLKSAWRLFSRNAVTPFAETELLGEFTRCLLDEWDRGRNVIRAREPWASPHKLATLLGELCFQLTVSQKEEFKNSDAERWLGKRFGDIPCERMLQLLSLQSGILCEQEPGRWRVSRDYFRRYFAASHVVESLGSPWHYLRDWRERDDIRNVLRMACGITGDATQLLRGVLEANDVVEADRCGLLAEILAQPVAAVPEVVAASCDAMVGWLDHSLRCLRLNSDPAEGWQGTVREPLWEIRAIGTHGDAFNPKVIKALGATHRARSGPARDLLLERLDKATSPFLPAFAASMQFEGRLHLECEANAAQRTLRAAVLAPEFA
jgi:transcriptional regulator with XRE-family HTH domain